GFLAAHILGKLGGILLGKGLLPLDIGVNSLLGNALLSESLIGFLRESAILLPLLSQLVHIQASLRDNLGGLFIRQSILRGILLSLRLFRFTSSLSIPRNLG